MKDKIPTVLEADFERLLLSGILGPRTTFAVHVTGPLNATSIYRLIQQISQLHAWLIQDESAATPSEPSEAPATQGPTP